jgi:hypothetical protein
MGIVLLAGCTFGVAHLLAGLRDTSWDQPANLVTGLCCGLISCLFVAVFLLRHETQTLPISQREPFLMEARTILHGMGYELTAQMPEDWTFRPCFHSFLFGGSIRITFKGQLAQVTGPRMSLDIFRRLYRLQHHVQRVQQVLHESRRFTENLLKRAELRLRLTPDQFTAVRRNVIEVLEQDGEVVCELHLLVQSDKGIRENDLEFQIREWLEENHISCDIHKDIVQFVEVVHSGRELEATPA